MSTEEREAEPAPHDGAPRPRRAARRVVRAASRRLAGLLTRAAARLEPGAAWGAADAHVAVLERRLASVEGRARATEAAVRRAAAGSMGAALVTDDLDAAFYLDFEARFRGSREEIEARQWDAVRFVASLVGQDAPLLDLGAGRGEWLSVVGRAGIPAYGVDSNAEMAAAAAEAGLDVRVGDALEHLSHLEPGTLGAITAFHLVEHVPLAVLRRLLDLALRALRPGGLLLLETPNPTNLVVGSAAFYLDPTHVRPLHPHFLQFLVEQHGFEGVELHLVHPVDEELAQSGQGTDRATRVLDAAAYAIFGPQDTVVFARRPASESAPEEEPDADAEPQGAPAPLD
jgi:O-antigen chain-terminating methyltransferase